MRKYILVWDILFLVLVLFGSQQLNSVFASELTDDYFDIATNYFNSNNYTKSLEYLDFVLQLEPDNLKAQTLRNKITPQVIVKTASAPESNTPTQISNTPSYTVVVLPKLDENAEPNAQFYIAKGQEYYRRCDYDTALSYFFKALEIDKNNYEAYNGLGMSYWLKNCPDIAIRYFKKANCICRSYTQSLDNLAMVYKQLGDERKQVFYLCKAVKINPKDYLAYHLLGDYYKSKGCYYDAIANYKNVVKINDKFTQAYLNLAICFLRTDQFDYALQSLNQYLELCPNSDFALFLVAKVHLAQADYSDAKKYIEKAISLNDRGEYQFELAKIDYYLCDYSVALNIFQNLLQTGGASAEIYNYMGLCNYKLNNLDTAILNLNKAINIDRLKPIYYYNLAQCYKKQGNSEAYTKNLNYAKQIAPISYQDYIDLSCIFVDNGTPSAAIDLLNEAIQKYPNIKSLYCEKMKLYKLLGDDLHYNETRNIVEMRFNKK